MCGSASSVPENWLGGFYQVYPVEEKLPEISEKWQSIDLETIIRIFPDCVEAYCILAFLAAEEEKEEWAGATSAYLDRLAVSWLRQEHSKVTRKRVWKWIRSFGKSRELTRTDISVILVRNFIQLFWSSMRSLAEKGYIRIGYRRIYGRSVEVFFPTNRLINKINCFLANSQ